MPSGRFLTTVYDGVTMRSPSKWPLVLRGAILQVVICSYSISEGPCSLDDSSLALVHGSFFILIRISGKLMLTE